MRTLLRRVWYAIRQGRCAADLAEEMEFHREMKLAELTAHGVTQRTQEIGIRVAFGAQSPQVVGLFVKRTVVQLVTGLALGLAGAIIVGRLLEQFLVRTAPTDPLILSLVSVLLIVVTMAASVWPARRAAHVDPVVALRYE